MQLTDLNPRWVGLHNFDAGSVYHVGLSFDSPVTGKRLAVLFDPPIDPDGLAARFGWGTPFPEARKWARSGDSFESLTLTPSVDFSQAGDWHGFITNGQVS